MDYQKTSEAKSRVGRLNGYFRTEEVAELLAVSRRTLSRWHRRRIGPPRIKIGNTVYYRQEAIFEWLKKAEVDVT